MIKQVEMGVNDVLIISNKNGVAILEIALKDYFGDNEILINPCDNSTGYDFSEKAKRLIRELKNI